MVYLEQTLEPCHELTLKGMTQYMRLLATIACEKMDRNEMFKDKRPIHEIFKF